LMVPPITTVQIPLREFAGTAVDALKCLMEIRWGVFLRVR